MRVQQNPERHQVALDTLVAKLKEDRHVQVSPAARPA